MISLPPGALCAFGVGRNAMRQMRTTISPEIRREKQICLRASVSSVVRFVWVAASSDKWLLSPAVAGLTWRV